jgi:hypothetical protein
METPPPFDHIDKTNLIIFLLGQASMFIIWLVRMDSTGTKAGRMMMEEGNRRFAEISDRIALLEQRLNQFINGKR